MNNADLTFEQMLEFFCTLRLEIHESNRAIAKKSFRFFRQLFNPYWSKERKWQFFRDLWNERIAEFVRECGGKMTNQARVLLRASESISAQNVQQALDDIGLGSDE